MLRGRVDSRRGRLEAAFCHGRGRAAPARPFFFSETDVAAFRSGLRIRRLGVRRLADAAAGRRPAFRCAPKPRSAAVADSPVSLVCSGRTDAGVHARLQVAHFETDAVRPLRGWTLGANSNLPRDISVAWVMPVPMHFHARYSAESRTYRYVIFNRNVRSAHGREARRADSSRRSITSA